MHGNYILQASARMHEFGTDGVGREIEGEIQVALEAEGIPATFTDRMRQQARIIQKLAAAGLGDDLLHVTELVAPLYAAVVPCRIVAITDRMQMLESVYNRRALWRWCRIVARSLAWLHASRTGNGRSLLDTTKRRKLEMRVARP